MFGRAAKPKGKGKITLLAKHSGAARQMLPSLPPDLLPGLVFSLLHKKLFLSLASETLGEKWESL